MEPTESLAERVALLVLQLTQIGLWAYILCQVSLSLQDPWPLVKNALIVLLALLTAGKAIVDTFFYPRCSR